MPTEKDKVLDAVASLVVRTDCSLCAGMGCDACMPLEEVKYYVNEYEVDRIYGGPEEGGWWYNTGKYIKCHGIFNSNMAAKRYRESLSKYIKDKNEYKHPPSSVLSVGDWTDIIIEEHEGKHFPERTPRYE